MTAQHPFTLKRGTIPLMSRNLRYCYGVVLSIAVFTVGAPLVASAEPAELAGSHWSCSFPSGPVQLAFKGDHTVDLTFGTSTTYRWAVSGRIAVLNVPQAPETTTFNGEVVVMGTAITDVLVMSSDSQGQLGQYFPYLSDSEAFSRAAAGIRPDGGPYPCTRTSGPSGGTGPAGGGTSSSDADNKKAPTAALVDPFSRSRSGAAGSSTPVERSQDSLVDPFGPPAKRPAQTTHTQSAKSETGGLADPFKEDGKNAEEKHARYWNTCARVYVASSSRSSTPNSYKVFAGNLCSQVLDVKFCIQRMNDGSGDLARNGSWDCGIKSNTTAAAARDGHPEDWYYGCCAVIYRTKVWAREPGFTEGWPEP